MDKNRKLAAAVDAKHYAGPRCRTCGSTTRYTVSGACVDCTKRRATARQRAAELDLDFDLAVIITAQEIVKGPCPSYGWGDVGEAIVQHIQGARTAEETMEQLRCLAEDYANHHRRTQ